MHSSVQRFYFYFFEHRAEKSDFCTDSTAQQKFNIFYVQIICCRSFPFYSRSCFGIQLNSLLLCQLIKNIIFGELFCRNLFGAFSSHIILYSIRRKIPQKWQKKTLFILRHHSILNESIDALLAILNCWINIYCVIIPFVISFNRCWTCK